MILTHRTRLFLGIVGLGTVPLAAAVLTLFLVVRSTASSAGPRSALEQLANTGRDLVTALDSLDLPPSTQSVLTRHAENLANQTTLARRADSLSRVATGSLAILVLVGGGGLLIASVQLARRWSQHVSAPINDLVGLVHQIEAGEVLPVATPAPEQPEVETLRSALYQLSHNIAVARQQEIERERLVTFREVARRVAHEIRGPLTSTQMAIRQLEHSLPDATAQTSLSVLKEESQRLTQMATEFSEFGRLPEGPLAVVNVRELIESVLASFSQRGASIEAHFAEDTLAINGRYQALRRGFVNLIQNALDAGGEQPVSVTVRQRDGDLTIAVVDHGSGISPDVLPNIFTPYYTTKTRGTGLGLAIAQQTVEAHGGRLVVTATPGGGSTFAATFRTTA